MRADRQGKGSQNSEREQEHGAHSIKNPFVWSHLSASSSDTLYLPLFRLRLFSYMQVSARRITSFTERSVCGS